MEPVIREYCKSDHDSCMAAFKSNVPAYFTVSEIVDFENFLFRLEKGDPKTRYFVMLYDQKVIGCGGFGDKEGTEVISLAWGLIHNEFHKRNFGDLLLTYRIGQLKKLDMKFPVVIDTTQHTYTFFEKYGFRTIKITNDYYTKGLHRYDMILKL